MQKIDFKKELSHLYKASARKTQIIEVPSLAFLLIDGEGAPGSEAYQEAVEALYKLAYTLKFMVKKGDMALDYGVMPLEGLWWAEDMNRFSVDRKDDWLWTMMIMQPEFISAEMVTQAREQLRIKKNPPALSKIRFESISEGLVAQVLHVGPFSEEGPTIQALHSFIAEEGYQLRGKHHEIYLTDIRRAAPERWKTIIRQPIGA